MLYCPQLFFLLIFMSRFQRKRPSDYLLPFFVIVSIGVIGVLGFRLLGSLQAKYGDVYFYVASGKAKVLNYGTSEWVNGYSGTKLLLGDSLKTAQNGRIVLQFFNGSIVRLAEDSEVTLTDLSKRSDSEKIALTLAHGTIWVSKGKSEGVSQSTVEVRTPHTLVNDIGTIFEVSSGQVETVRVLRGNVKVHVLDTDGGKNQKLDTIDVGVGQEVNFDSAVLKAFQNRQNPSVLMAFGDQFRASEWYNWNAAEDQNPSDFSKPSSIAASQKISDQQVQKPLAAETQEKVESPQQDIPAKNVKTKETVSGDTLKTPEAKSVSPQIETGSKPASTPPKEALAAPFVLTFNGQNISRNSMSAETNLGVVKVEGEVHGAAKVVINGFTLGKFQPGSTKWIYYANENGDNLKPGLNKYEAYAVDADGKESEHTQFEIIYNKPVASPKPAVGTVEKSAAPQ